MANMDYKDLYVCCQRKAVNLNNSLTDWSGNVLLFDGNKSFYLPLKD